jgi:TerC family integral membrane protein
MVAWYWWTAFLAGFVALLLLDLLVVQRKPHKVETREAALWSAIWIALGLSFALLVWRTMGARATQNYLTGYLIEKSLSVDNLFVFVLIFNYFKVPAAYQHRVLFWGVLGALVFRGIFIALGVTLLNRFSWVAFLFGGFLIYTAYRLGMHGGVEVDPRQNPVLKALRRWVRITRKFHQHRLFVRLRGRWAATPLFAVLVVVETTDIVFAVDSIPAILGVTRDAFVVFSSNAFALLGLRALYFVLADMMDRFHYLDAGLAAILGSIGVKMIYEEIVHLHEHGTIDWLPHALLVDIPAWAPLVLVAVILAAAIALSLRYPIEAPEADE